MADDSHSFDTPLHVAASCGQLEDVKRLMKSKQYGVNITNSVKRTPLHLACLNGHLDIVDVLVNKFYANMGVHDCDNNTALLLAARNGHAVIVIFLILTSMSGIKSPNNFRAPSPVNVCSQLEGHHKKMLEVLLLQFYQDKLAKGEAAKLLLSKFDDLFENAPQVADDMLCNAIPMFLAAFLGLGQIIAMLAKRNAIDISLLKINGLSLLHCACFGGHTNLIETLISEYSLDYSLVDNKGLSILHYAAEGGNVDTVKLLISKYKLDCNKKSREGHSLLSIAAQNGRLDTVRLLINQFNCSPTDKIAGSTLLHLACQVDGAHALIDELIENYHLDPTATDSEGQTPLHIAVIHGQVSSMRHLIIKYKVSCDIANSKGYFPICLAVYYGHAKVMETLIKEFKCDPFIRGPSGQTLLHYACQNGHIELISELIHKYQLNPADKNDYNHTLLHIAASNGHASIVKHLIKQHKLSCSATDSNGLSPIELAALNGQVKVVQTLINKFKCDPHAKRNNGCTLLHYACFNGHTELADKLLTKYRVYPMAKNESSEEPLHKATERGHIEVTKLLITKHKVKVNTLTKHRFTPLMLAVLNGHMNAVRLLIDECKCSHQPASHKGTTLIHLACGCGHTEVVEELITRYNLNPLLKNDTGNTPLHIAAICGDTNTVKYLILKQNADVSIRNNEDATPLCIAAQTARADTVRLLLNDFKCDPLIIGFKGKTLLHYACQGGNVDIIRELVSKYHLDPTVKDDDGDTPFHIAASNGKLEAIEYLINECKVEIGPQNIRGMTPLLMAAQWGHNQAVKILIQEFNSDFTVKSLGEFTVLHYACMSGNVELVAQLVTEYHLNPAAAANGRCTALHCAALGGHLQILKYFIDKCKIDISEFSFSLLYMTALNGQTDTVQALIKEFNCDPRAIDASNRNRTLLHMYALHGGKITAVIDKLISEYRLNIMAIDADGFNPLDTAAGLGQVEVIRHFMTQYKKQIGQRSVNASLCLAATNGQSKVVQLLVREFGCNPKVKNDNGQTLLHCACICGSIELLNSLITEYSLKKKLDCKDNLGNSCLHLAATYGHAEIVIKLIVDYHLEANIENFQGMTPLLLAAENAHWNTVQILIEQFDCNVKATNKHGWTLLHYTCLHGNTSLSDDLIKLHHLDPKAEDSDNNTPLHVAAQRGHLEILQHVITVHKVDISNIYFSLLCLAAIGGQMHTLTTLMLTKELNPCFDKIINGQTLLHLYAHEGSKTTIVDLLINSGNENPMAVDEHGDTALHVAASNGRITLVRHLISRYNVIVNIPNNNGFTPLCLAAMEGHKDVVNALIREFKCDPHTENVRKATLLHLACQASCTDLIDELIKEYFFTVPTPDEDGNTSLHIAAQFGQLKVFHHLINSVQKDDISALIHCRNSLGKSLVHMACFSGNVELVETLVDEYKLSLLSLDHEGNTPLHIAAMQGNVKCVRTLLFKYNVPIHLKNNNEQTCVSAEIGSSSESASHVSLLFSKYIKEKGAQVQTLYQDIFKLSEKEQLTKVVRVFVLGNHGGGKTTLVDTLKRTFKSSIFNFFRSEVEPHTAGIVPSVIDSSLCGRLLIYDFAGDREYYSSHAAILQNYESQGSNLFIIVLNLELEKGQIEYRFGYWLNFLSIFQKNAYILPIGSHSDCLSDQLPLVAEKILLINKTAGEFTAQRGDMQILDTRPIDCRDTKQVTQSVRDIVQQISTGSPSSELSLEAKLLIGLLKKDFSNVVACSVGKITQLIREYRIPLPQDPSTIYPILKELYRTGFLLLIEKEQATLQFNIVILQLRKVTEELHKRLFSKSAKELLSSKIDSIKLTVGVIPESLLPAILPKYITKECLLHLQYCQELKHAEIAQDFTLTTSQHTDGNPKDESVLFFPALCGTEKHGEFQTHAKCAFGWYAICDKKFEYFPIRFLHVLMMRMVHKFPMQQHRLKPVAVSGTPRQKALLKTHQLNPGCQVWSTGLHWLMENGVEAFVDMVKDSDSKQLIVITRGDEDSKVECVTVLRQIVQVISETKVELCYHITPTLYLLNPDDLMGKEFPKSVSTLPRYHLEEILEAWRSNKKHVLSADSKRRNSLPIKKIPLEICTHWNVFFPMDISMVCSAIKEVTKWKILGMNLNVLWDDLVRIEETYPDDSNNKERVLQLWMLNKPSWPSLVKALREPSIALLKVADDISKEHNVPLQQKILDEKNSAIRPEGGFLESFAAIIGSRWQCFASPLSLTSDDIACIKRDITATDPSRQALAMLQKWAASETATYGQLREKLCTLSVFHI